MRLRYAVELAPTVIPPAHHRANLAGLRFQRDQA
jgi:hypothetical protein